MRFRNIFFIVLVVLLIGLILFLAIKKKNHNLRGYIMLGISIVLLGVAIWLMLFPPYSKIKPTGEYEVAYVSQNLIDETRVEEFKNDGSKRELEIGTWYPKDKTTNSSLIVFSHGSFGTIQNNETLCTELALRGYIVTSIAHTYHAFSANLSTGKVKISNTYFNEIMSEDVKTDKEKSFNLYQKWMKLRTDDINFVLESLYKMKDENNDIFKYINKDKVCLMGHSLGGSAALGVGRTRGDIKAVVALESPFMTEIIGVEDDEFVLYDTPYPTNCLNVYSDSSYNKLESLLQYKRNYDLVKLNDPKYENYYFEGIGHMHLCDFSLESPFLSWVLSGCDSNTSAKQNLKKLNDIVIDYLNRNNI